MNEFVLRKGAKSKSETASYRSTKRGTAPHRTAPQRSAARCGTVQRGVSVEDVPSTTLNARRIGVHHKLNICNSKLEGRNRHFRAGEAAFPFQFAPFDLELLAVVVAVGIDVEGEVDVNVNVSTDIWYCGMLRNRAG